MIGFISTTQNTIYLKDSSESYDDKDFSGMLLENNYPDIKVWLSDALSMMELSKYRFNTNNGAIIMPVNVWDIFSIFGKVDVKTIISMYGDLHEFHPAIKNIKNKNDPLWAFEYPELDCELPPQTSCALSKSQSLSATVDLMEFLLWLIQQDIILPKGKPKTIKMKLKAIISEENHFNLSLFVKKEQIENLLKEKPSLINIHWKSDWIAASWLRCGLYENIERSLEREFDVLVYEEVQPIGNLMPVNFNLGWLFCPSAHYVFHKWLNSLVIEQKKNQVRFQLMIYLFGLFVLYKMSRLDNYTFLTSEFTFFNWQAKLDNRKSSNVRLSNKQ